MPFKDAIESVGKAVDAAGVATIVLGAVGTVGAPAMSLRAPGRPPPTATALSASGSAGAILLGLELLVAADIIRTVAVTPTFTSAGVLGIIVVIRTFLRLAGRSTMDH